ncbi:Xyloglucan 6-xylosyltransferase 1 [Spatholobus suberectus]|nr:Xyloglucan 6-xylosyltransferase 1 [Spatholobus suberectus]
MLERCLGPRRVRQMQRACRHSTVTFLCLFLTVIVLRGTIGAGKFGTPGQDFDEIRHHLSAARTRRVLEESNPNTDSNPNNNNYATFDLSKILVDEPPPTTKSATPTNPTPWAPKSRTGTSSAGPGSEPTRTTQTSWAPTSPASSSSPVPPPNRARTRSATTTS